MDLRRVFDDLVRFETDLWNGIDARLRQECAVSMGSFDVMMLIERVRPCRVQDVAAALSITVGGASQAVDRLERAGRCLRSPNPADRRSSVIELTGEGRDLLRAAKPVFDQELADRLAGPLSETALGRLAESLTALRAATPRDPVRGEPGGTP